MAAIAEENKPSTSAPTERFTDVTFGNKAVETLSGEDLSTSIWDWLKDVLNELEEREEQGEPGPHPKYHLNFPASLSNAQRKQVHQYAYELKLRSTSHGDGEQRFIRLTLQNKAALSPNVLTLLGEDSSSSLEEAIAQREAKKHHRVPKGMSHILDHLYLGSGKDAADKEVLQQVGITVILNVTTEWRQTHLKDFVHHRINLHDTVKQPIKAAMEAVTEIVWQAKQSTSAPAQKVLIHCVMGRSRSASMVMAYLVAKENMSLREAFEHTHKIRPIIRPNSGFMQELIDWELQHRGSTTLDVASWVALVGVHGSQVQAPKKLPLKVAPTFKKQASETVAPFLSEDLYLKVVKEKCDETYSTKLLGTFMNGVKQVLEVNAELISICLEGGVHLAEATKAAQLASKPWYMTKVEAATTQASSSSVESSAPPSVNNTTEA